MPRHLGSWIGSFMQYTEKLPSPELFRRWVGISIIGGVLERKVWIRSLGMNLYPNLYTILVAPPGVGKSVLTEQARRFWLLLSTGHADGQHIAPSSVTKASLVDALSNAERKILTTPKVTQFHSLKILSNELGVLLPGYDTDFMNVLTDVYDGFTYSEERRTNSLKRYLENPQLHLLAGTTPSYLKGVLPEGAWDQGFLSRTILVYSGETTLRPLFDEETLNDRMHDELAHDLVHIGNLFGKMTFTPEAAEAIEKWHIEGGPPRPDHPKLLHYCTRRTAHLLKLTMISSMSRSDSFEIGIDAFHEALDWLLEVETYIPDIFKSMSGGGDMRAIEDTWYHVYKLYMKEKEPIAERRVIAFLSERTPAHRVMQILELMVKGGVLDKVMVNKLGPAYIPKGRRPI